MITRENQLRTIIDTIPALAWSADPDGSAEFFNRRWLDYSGLSIEEARNWGWTAAVHADDLNRLADYWRSILASGEPGEIEARLRRFDGVYRWFLFQANPLRDESGNIIKWYGTNTDIEDRKRAEDALRTSEHRLRLVVDGLPGFVFTATADGEVEFVNQQILDYTGRTLEELKRWATTDLVHPDDLPQVIDELRRSIETGQSQSVEHRVRGADGLYRWFDVRHLPQRDTQGRIIRWYLLLSDIDDRKRAEDAIRTAERDLRLILETIPGFVWTMTAAGEVELVSQQMLEYFGKTPEELKDWSLFVHPEDRARVIAYWKRTIETGQSYDVEHRLRRADGAYHWFHGRGRALRDAEGHVVRWHNLLTDVDDRKQAEEKLRRSEWLLLEAQRLGHSGWWSLDIASGTVSCSPEGLRLFDPQLGEDHSRPDFFFNRIHPEDRERVRDLFERCVIEKTDYQADFRLLLPDGTIKYHHTVGHPILSDAGDLVEFVGTGIDTTEQMQARKALENALTEVKLLRDQLYKENLALRDEVDRVSMFEEILGASPAMQAVVSRVVKVAPTDSSVLITGETGTGKELVARAIHKRSARSQRAFVSVNCAALAPSLISSELFGHEKGAFTGATQRRLGRFELANGGTIFLDEIGELPADTQVALLRVLQERELERVGGMQSIQVDVRVIAATNRDLEAAMANGTFRRDLFYRLNVFPIQLPPLRERKEDILTLLEYFVHRFGRKLGKTFPKIDKRTVELFRSYDWPGNVRELQNVVERSVILSPDDVFSVDEAWLSTDAVKTRSGRRAPEPANGDSGRERQIIEAALAESRGRVYGPNGAAAKLRIPPSTLDSKIKKLQIRKSHFRLS